MKRFTVVTALFSVSSLAVWMIFQLFTASQPIVKKDNPTLELQPSHNEIMKAVDSGKEAVVPVTGPEARTVAPAPVYDASGRITALNPNDSSSEAVVLGSATNVKVAPVYDATGAVISDPNGSILNASDELSIDPVFHTPPMSDYRPIDHSFHTPPMSDYKP